MSVNTNHLPREIQILDAISFMRNRWIGQGELSASRIAWYTSIPLASVQRRLRKMEEEGLLEHEIRDKDTKPKFSWFLTDEGIKERDKYPELGWTPPVKA